MKALIILAVVTSCSIANAQQKNASITDCRQWTAAKGMAADVDVSILGLRSQGKSGMFVGEVTGVDTETGKPGTAALTIYSKGTRTTSIALLAKSTTVLSEDRVNVGAIVVGYGTQAAAIDVDYTSGAKGRAAVINAACVSPVSMQELFGRMAQ